MRRGLFVLACVATLGILAIPRVRCAVRGRGHKPKRQALGGFRCADCGTPSADLEGMGFGDQQLAPLEKRFTRHGLPKDAAGLERTARIH